VSDDRRKREILTLEEATGSSMWEMAVILEVLEQKSCAQLSRNGEVVVRKFTARLSDKEETRP
jgi:hypothetical protein